MVVTSLAAASNPHLRRNSGQKILSPPPPFFLYNVLIRKCVLICCCSYFSEPITNFFVVIMFLEHRCQIILYWASDTVFTRFQAPLCWNQEPFFSQGTFTHAIYVCIFKTSQDIPWFLKITKIKNTMKCIYIFVREI